MLGEDIKPPVDRKYVIVKRTVYSQFPGRYQVSGDYWIDIYEENNGLSIQWTGMKSRLLLFPVSENTYFIRENNKEFTFNQNANGEIESLSFPDSGYDIVAKKIN
jgi:hypothetical protein